MIILAKHSKEEGNKNTIILCKPYIWAHSLTSIVSLSPPNYCGSHLQNASVCKQDYNSKNDSIRILETWSSNDWKRPPIYRIWREMRQEFDGWDRFNLTVDIACKGESLGKLPFWWQVEDELEGQFHFRHLVENGNFAFERGDKWFTF